MSRAEKLKARFSDGTLRTISVNVSEKEPWQLEFVEMNGDIRRFQGRDLFEALRAMRENLEREGCQLLCAGARIDVTPSGMSRSMSGGRKAYIVRSGKPVSANDMVDIFDYAGLEVVGTVRQQLEYIESWTRVLR